MDDISPLAPESVTVGTGTSAVLISLRPERRVVRSVFDGVPKCFAELSVRGLGWRQRIECCETLCEAHRTNSARLPAWLPQLHISASFT